MKNKQQILQRIEMSLDTMRPYLQKDGGNIEVVEFTNEGVLRLKLTGNCESCPQSYFTMHAGVEEAVLKSVSEVKKVEAINVSPKPEF